MRKSMMMSVAAIALMASAGLASAQMSQGGGQAGSAQMKQDNPQQSGHPADTGKGGANAAQPRAGAEGSKAEGPKAEGTKADSPKAAGTKAEGTTGQGTKGDKAEAPKKNDTGKADSQKKSDTVGQAQPGSAREKQDTPQQSGRPADTGKGGPNTAQPSENRTGGSSSTTSQSSTTNTNVNVNLSTEQRTKIRETIVAQKVAPEKNVNIQVNVGSIVPKTVHVHPLPATIVSIQPAWRGYMFFLVGDEIVIVEPGSLRIVAVLPA